MSSSAKFSAGRPLFGDWKYVSTVAYCRLGGRLFVAILPDRPNCRPSSCSLVCSFIIRVTFKPCSERPTQLNSTQLAVGLSWVELSCKSVQSASGALNTLTTQLNSTEKNRKSLSFSPVAEFWTFSELVELSWVELSRALWTRRKLLKTGRDPVCSVWLIVACHDSEFSAYRTL